MTEPPLSFRSLGKHDQIRNKKGSSNQKQLQQLVLRQTVQQVLIFSQI
jgi:hypothetical protein